MASLQELPDDELDKLFRSSAEEFEPPYNPDDWNSLRRRLDDDDRLRFLDRFIYWGLPLLLLLLTTTSLLVSPTDGPLAAQTVARQPASGLAPKAATPAPRRADAPNGPASTETKRSEAPSTETDSPKPAQSETGETTDRNTEPGETRAASKNTVGEKPSEAAGGIARSAPGTAPDAAGNRSNRNGPSANEVTTSSTNEIASPELVTKNRLARSENSGKKAVGLPVPARFDKRSVVPGNWNRFENTAAAHAERGNPVQNRTHRPTSGPTGLTGAVDARAATTDDVGSVRSNAATTGSEPVPFDLLGNLAYIPARPPQQPPLPPLPELDLEPMRPPVVPKIGPSAVPVVGYPALSIRIMAAPDLNFVGSSDKGANDFQVGVLAEYRFLRRLTVQAGVLRSVKKYRAAASDYAKPEHWYGPMYESVDAVCTVLDIPVNLRFDFLLNDRRRWFISSGVSSYIMQEERYKYNYPYGINPTQPKYKEWYGKTGFHEWSHFNFSFGYERNFRPDGPLRRLSWQIEPFLKDPRRSTLGYGKIRLMSTGVFFSLRYRL